MSLANWKGLGGALGYTACMVVVGFNFHRRRKLALGVAISGVDVGMFVMAPLMQMSRDYYGTRGFFIILAAMSTNIVTFGVLCFPSNLEITASQMRKSKGKQTESVRFQALREYGKVAFNRSVMCLCVSMFNYGFSTILIYLHLPTYLGNNGFSPTQAALIISISGIMNAIGRLLTGFVASLERVPDIGLHCGSMAIMSVATLMLPLYSMYIVGNVVYTVVLGLFIGSCYVVTASISINFVGIQFMSAAIGLQLFFCGIGAVIGPVLAGVIVDSGGSYADSYLVAGDCLIQGESYAESSCIKQPPVLTINNGGCFLLASIVSGVSACFNGKKNPKQSNGHGNISMCYDEPNMSVTEYENTEKTMQDRDEKDKSEATA